MKITLCRTPNTETNPVPLGIAYLKSYLLKEGHEVKVVDFSFNQENYPNLFIKDFHDFDKIEEIISDYKNILNKWVDKINDTETKFIGFSIWISSRMFSCALASVIKKRCPDKILIAGGPDIHELTATNYIKYFDYLIQNEGELRICSLLNEISSEKSTISTDGIWYKENGKLLLSSPPKRIVDINNLPFPDFDDINIKDYPLGLPVLFSRGCNYRCTFCDKETVLPDGQITRSGDNVYNEIISRIEQYNIRTFYFIDDSL
jgi:anaerobic magnesium-protoporphyrin IX monomethyl ester cyclase